MTGLSFREVSIIEVPLVENIAFVQSANLCGSSIGDDVFVGPFTDIQKVVKISARRKVQCQAFICEKVDIGENCFIGHGVMFINDVFATGRPAGDKRELWRSTRIGHLVPNGSNSALLQVEIYNDVMIGAGDVITQNITKSGAYSGNPARHLRELLYTNG